MKPIKHSQKRTSLPLRFFMVLALIVGAAAFWIDYQFNQESVQVLPSLKYDPEMSSPECSAKGGFHSSSFGLSLTTAQGFRIYYTTDGTTPDLGSQLYSEPILITDRTEEENILSGIPTSPRWKPPINKVFKGTVIRAISVNEQNIKGSELIRTFWVSEKGSHRYSFPVIALTVEPDDMFGFKNGIYVLGKNYEDKDRYIRKNLSLNLPWWEYPSNYHKRGDNSERNVHVEYYESDGALGFTVDAGLRIHGNATRGFPQKALRVTVKGPKLSYSLFPETENKNFCSFLLRNSGNDWNKSMFRDAFMQSLMKSTALDLQNYQPVIVFINGEYWGIHELKERQDENYLSFKYNLNKDSLAILENNGIVMWGNKKDGKKFEKLIAFISKSDLNDKAAYEEILKKIDVENFMDLIIANVYFCNADWPGNNVKFWRYRSAKDTLGKADGRWRWMLFDTDWGFGYTGSGAYGASLLEKAKNTGSLGVIFSGLLENEDFRKKFRSRFEQHLNSIFSNENVLKTLEKFEKMLGPEMHEHIDRWRSIGSYSNWESYISEMKEFQVKRHELQLKQLDEFLSKQK